MAPAELHSVYLYLRDGKHCFVCQWPCDWVVPYQATVTRRAEALWKEPYPHHSNVGHCTLDCPNMAPWDVLVARMQDLAKVNGSGDIGFDGASVLATELTAGLQKRDAGAANPVTAFLGPGTVPQHLLAKTDANTWRVFDPRPPAGKIFPWPVGQHVGLPGYIEALLAVATFLRTGRVAAAREVLNQGPESKLRRLADRLTGGLPEIVLK